MKSIRVSSEGFTLIELLVVIAIIGILSAIAIPQFAAYRQKGFDARANSDLGNAAIAEEAYFATFLVYKSVTCGPAAGSCAALPGLIASETVTTAMTANGTASFTGTASSNQGTGTTFSWDSAAGGMQ